VGALDASGYDRPVVGFELRVLHGVEVVLRVVCELPEFRRGVDSSGRALLLEEAVLESLEELRCVSSPDLVETAVDVRLRGIRLLLMRDAPSVAREVRMVEDEPKNWKALLHAAS
jgi:hypothetical protein